MKRLLGLLFAIFLFGFTQQLFAQAQVTVPPADTAAPPPPPAHIDSAVDSDLEVGTPDGDGNSHLNSWLKQQAEELRTLLGCYLSEKSLKDEVTLETKDNSDPKRLIEVRIALLKDFAKHNAPSHCK